MSIDLARWQAAPVFVAGHRGMVGQALVRTLQAAGFENLLLRTRQELDLRDQAAVRRFFQQVQPRLVFLAAARVGGIWANKTQPGAFIYDNLAIQTSVLHEAAHSGVERLLFFGSSCIYPRECPQPIREEYLLTGPLEPTNRAYAVAKIAGIEMCRSYNHQYGTNYLGVMPTNLYGPGDNYDLETSHVLAALLHKMHLAKADGHRPVTLWGTGTPRREFLHVDDLAEACLHLMGLTDRSWQEVMGEGPPILNIGWGRDLSIRELAERIAGVVGFEGEIHWDAEKPDGTPRKLLDTGRMHNLGWGPRISLDEGLRLAYAAFLRETEDS